MDLTLFFTVLGIILTVLVPLFGYVYKTQKEMGNYYSVIWKNSAKLKAKDLLGERPYEEYYFPRSVDAFLEQTYASRSNALIIGPPLSGKTRAVFNSLRNSADTYLLVPRNVPMQGFRLPRDYFSRKKKLIFIDDLQYYVEKQEQFHLLFREAHRNNIPVIAACHSGKEYTKVKNKLTEQNLNIDIVFRDNVLEFEKLSMETGKQVAEKLGMKWDSVKFNGTIGSIFMRLSEMERRFDTADTIEKTILRVLRNLYLSGVYDNNNLIRTAWIKKAAGKYELEAKEFEWAGWFKSLEGKEFIKVMGGGKIWAEDAYLEYVVKPEAETSMYEVFDNSIEIFKDDHEVLHLAGEKIYSYALDDAQFISYLKLAITAFEREHELISIQPGKTDIIPDEKENLTSILVKCKDNLGESYWNLGQTQNTLGNAKKALEYYNEILELISKEENAYEYARLKMKIGDAHKLLTFVDNIEERSILAINAYNEALEIFTIETNPLDLAYTYNNLGSAYQLLTESQNPVGNSKKALEAFNDARKVRDLTGYPKNEAFTKFNTANTYMYLAGYEDKEKNLDEAIRLFEEYNSSPAAKKSARVASGVLNNMGYGYMLRAGVKDKKANLTKALELFNKANETRTREEMPLDYTETMCNLGEAYMYLSETADEELNLLKAKDTLEEALKTKEIEKHPMTFSTIKFTLGKVEIRLGKLTGGSGNEHTRGLKLMNEAAAAVKGHSAAYHDMVQSSIEKVINQQKI